MGTEIYAFRKMDQEVALELQEDMEYADQMAASVLEHIKAKHTDSIRDELEIAFAEFDQNRDGFVSHEEFALFMIRLDVKMSSDRLTKLLQIVDPAGNDK